MKSMLLFLLSFICFSASSQVADIIITNGRILDGTGNSWFYGDIAIKDGKIIKVGTFSGITAAKTIDAKKMIVAPGFIDVHTHIEGRG